MRNSECGIGSGECGMRNAEGEIGEVSRWFSSKDVELVNSKKQEIVNCI